MKVLISACMKDMESTEAFARALRQLGHDVFVICADAAHPGFFLARAMRRIPLRSAKYDYWSAYRKIVNRRILDAADLKRPDIYLSVGGEHVYGETIRKISSAGRVSTVCWVTDEAAALDEDDPYRWLNFSAYDRLYCVDELWAQSLQLFPIPKIYLPFAGDSVAYMPDIIDKDIDVLFLGDFYPSHPHIASGYGRAVILSSILNEDISVVGCGPGVRSMAPYIQRLKSVPVMALPESPAARNKLYNRAKIIICLSRMLLKTDYDPEIYNMALSGAFILTDGKENAKKLFGETLETFHTRSELVGKTKYYLLHDAERIEVAKKMRAVVAERHTYKDRAQQFLETLNSQP